ncbi:MAG: hypothetical protein LBI57_04945 [Helicobacteraceae bacterium]|nr:hypothetical protein [Helicobacteraceae bacterium]
MKSVLSVLVLSFFVCGCAALLIDREWLDAGFTAEDYDRVKAWGELEVKPAEAKAWEDAGFAPSYTDGDTMRFRPPKNMPDNKVFGLHPNVWRQSGFRQNELSEARSGGIPSSRVGAMKPAFAKELKNLGIAPKEWRYYLDSSDSSAKNYDLNAIKQLRKLGFSGERIDEWRSRKRKSESGFTQEEAIGWIKVGVKKPDEAVEAEEGGYSPAVWSAIKSSGISQEDWSYCIDKGLSVKEAKAWSEIGVKCTRNTPRSYIDAKLSPSQVKPWTAAGFGDAGAIAFIRNGFSVSEAARWLRAFNADVISVGEIATWRKASFSADDAKKWRSTTRSASVAAGYRKAGLSPDRIVNFLIANGVSPSVAAAEYRKIHSACGSNFTSDRAFFTRMPQSLEATREDDPTGKCVIPSGLSRTRSVEKGLALYRISNDRRVKARYEIDGYALISYSGEAPQSLNGNIVLKIEETDYQATGGAVLSAKTVWKKR